MKWHAVGRAAAIILCALTLLPVSASAQTVRFATTLGNVDVILAPSVAPKAVANFLNYVNKGANGGYDTTIIHRDVPGFVIQGGGYYYNGGFSTVPADAPVANEFSLSNTRGTIALAKVGNDPNSATSQWFFNLVDNNLSGGSANLDTQNGGFTVFGQIADKASLAVMDKIAASPIYNAGAPFDQLPVTNFTGGIPTASNLIFVNSIKAISGVAGDYYITASPNTVNITAGQSGSATLTVTPVNGFQGTVTLSCDNPPTSASCVFAPATLTFGAGSAASQTTVLTINTKTATSSGAMMASADEPPTSLDGAGKIGRAALFVAALLGLAMVAVRRTWLRQLAAGLTLVLLTSCGGSSDSSAPVTVVPAPTPTPTPTPSPTMASVTPAGTYSVPITVSSGATTHPANLTVVVR